ncbi:hypothetical protein AQJ46_43450 [Streptomyces canus]|uniref:Uncharacterized protein n=1 Tax=Streptomyces canus TaxID=58343 RepID=A0A101RMH6_9ACTN|nr:hypothetical protein AQJ46_43450 [Streptomyces canus]
MGEGFGTFGSTSRDHDLLDFSYRAHGPKLHPGLCTRTHDAHPDRVRSGGHIHGDSANGTGSPCAKLRTMHECQQLAIPGTPNSHQLLSTDKGVVRPEAEHLLLAQMPGSEDEVPVTEIGAHTRRRLHAAFIAGQDCRPYGPDSSPGIELGANIVVVEQSRRHMHPFPGEIILSKRHGHDIRLWPEDRSVSGPTTDDRA